MLASVSARSASVRVPSINHVRCLLLHLILELAPFLFVIFGFVFSRNFAVSMLGYLLLLIVSSSIMYRLLRPVCSVDVGCNKDYKGFA